MKIELSEEAQHWQAVAREYANDYLQAHEVEAELNDVATKWVAQFVRFALREEILPRLRLPRGGGQSVVAVANYSVYIIGVVFAAGVTGLSGTQVTVVVGALSVGIGLGLLVIMFRMMSTFPEGVMFAVLMMNAVVPLMNRWTIPTPVGGPVPEKK